MCRGMTLPLLLGSGGVVLHCVVWGVVASHVRVLVGICTDQSIYYDGGGHDHITPHTENNMNIESRAVNLRTEQYDVYCGRPRAGQPWNFGNPFIVGRDAPKGQCIPMFELWLETGDPQGCPDATPERRQWILNNIHTLKGKRLGCFCKPRPCHCDILANKANTQGE